MASLRFLRQSFVLPPSLRWGTKTRDLLAGVPLAAFYGLCAHARVRSLIGEALALGRTKFDWKNFITLLSDISTLSVALLFVVCVLLRPPAIARAQGIMPRVAALVGTYLSVGLVLFVSVTTTSVAVICLSLLMVFCGMGFAAWAIFYLGRSVSLMAEARKLVTGGPYRVVRHPLYLGEQVSVAGVLLQYLSPAVLFVFVVQIAFQFYRMSCEEKILAATFPEYPDYAKRTWRLLPGLY